MKLSPLEATFALAMSAILLMVLCELAESGFRNRCNNIAKKIAKTIAKDTYCGKTECKKCASHPNPFLSMMLIVQVADNFPITFGTAIGRRIVLTARGSNWSAKKEDYLVFVMSDKSFIVQDERHYCGINDIIKKSNEDNTEIVLLVLDKDIPDTMVPACLPKYGVRVSTQHRSVLVPFYSLENGKEDDEFKFKGKHTLTVKVFQMPFVILPEEINKRTLKLKDEFLFRNAVEVPSRSETFKAPAGPVTYNVNGYAILFGITEMLGTPPNYEPYVVTITPDDVLNWINLAAEKNCVCRIP